MQWHKVTGALLACGMMTLTIGCAQRQPTKTVDRAPRASGMYMPDRGEEPAARPAPARTGWPTHLSDAEFLCTAQAFPTGDPSTSGLGVEKCVPRETISGQEFVGKIWVTNLTDIPLTNVIVASMPEAELNMIGSDPQGRREPNGNTVWFFENLGPREQKVITFRASATGTGNTGICTKADFDNQICAVIAVVSPELRLTKSGPAEVTKCEDITYRFVVTNTGTGTVSNVMITDNLPDGLAGTGGQRTLSLPAGDLTAGASKEITTTVKANRTGRFSNTASASGAVGEGSVSADSGMVATVVRAPELAVSMACDDISYVGRDIDYTITVTNNGDGACRDTAVTATLPSGSTFVSADQGGAGGGGQASWNVGALAPGDSRTFRMVATAGATGTYQSTATARCFCADAVSDSCSIEVKGIPAILLEVIDIDDPIEVGENETYVITVTNQGSATDTNIQITCTLEDTQEFVSGSGETAATARGKVITFAPLASLGAKQRATWRFVAKCVGSGDTRFAVEMKSDQLGRTVNETEATNIYE